MRLPGRIRSQILPALRARFGDVPVYLFGSRADDTKKGGDIDLAIATDMERNEFRTRKIQFLVAMTRRNLEVRIDVVQLGSRTDALLKREILDSGVLLAGTSGCKGSPQP